MVETSWWKLKSWSAFLSHFSHLRSLNRGMRWGRLQQITELSAEELPGASDCQELDDLRMIWVPTTCSVYGKDPKD